MFCIAGGAKFYPFFFSVVSVVQCGRRREGGWWRRGGGGRAVRGAERRSRVVRRALRRPACCSPRSWLKEKKNYYLPYQKRHSCLCDYILSVYLSTLRHTLGRKSPLADITNPPPGCHLRQGRVATLTSPSRGNVNPCWSN